VRNRVGFSVDLEGSFGLKRTVGSYMAAPPQEAGQADFCLPAIAVGTQVHILILDLQPESFDEYVVVRALSA
jgi:hypothetical protein